MSTIKTAISLDDRLFNEANLIAEEMKISRSQVFARALEEYILHYRNQQLLHQINEAYADTPDSEDQEIHEFIRYQRRKLGRREEWK
jgi:metal-responsive CopG/Arc/MetJ family transcriptional regulator